MTPTVLITRPRPGAARFARALRARCPELPIMISPLQCIVPEVLDLPPRNWAGVIVTSQNAVAALPPELAGLTAWCVGDRSARAAAAAGLDARSAGGDARDLRALIVAQARGPLLYLHGAHRAADLASELNSAGIETISRVAYRQVPVPLDDEARAVLARDAAVVLPLFSARSARLAGEATRGARAALKLVSISEAVDRAWSGDPPVARHVAARPTQDALLAVMTSQWPG